MINYLLWISLGFFIIASILPQQYRLYKLPVGAIGWIFFAGCLGLSPLHYLGESDFSMILLMLIAAFLSLIIAHLMISTYLIAKKAIFEKNPIDREKTLMTVTKAVAIGCLFYFPFAHIDPLNKWLISTVTSQTLWLSHQTGFPVDRLDWNTVILEGHKVQIILGCTAIESIALFFGIILAAGAEKKRVFLALMASIPVIYILNIIRNTFVVGAYGYEWFGAGPMIVNIFSHKYYLHDSASFFLGHHIIAKVGSGIALFFIAYTVLKLLPEFLITIDNLWILIKEDLNHIFGGG
jgi:archaeosortase A (PGF-CTERM-specific)